MTEVQYMLQPKRSLVNWSVLKTHQLKFIRNKGIARCCFDNLKRSFLIKSNQIIFLKSFVDLRLIKTYLEMALPGHNLDFLMSEGNQVKLIIFEN
jgi:hypothetical protein